MLELTDPVPSLIPWELQCCVWGSQAAESRAPSQPNQELRDGSAVDLSNHKARTLLKSRWPSHALLLKSSAMASQNSSFLPYTFKGTLGMLRP
jgi:hypothetical protein